MKTDCRRFLALLMILVLIVSLTPGSAFAWEERESESAATEADGTASGESISGELEELPAAMTQGTPELPEKDQPETAQAAGAGENPPLRGGNLDETNYGDLSYSWNIRWNTAADDTNYTYDEDGRLLLHPHDRSALNASISIEMSVSASDPNTQQTIPAGAVQFHIPAHLFLGWNGKPADVLSTQVATDPAAASNNKVSFIYSIQGDEIVVSNFEPLEGGTYFIADFAYIANPLDVNGGHPDETKEHENWWDNYVDCYEKTFTACFSISDGIDTEQGEKDFSLRVMTRVISVANCVVMPDANKGVYLAWQDAWGDRPSDAEQYFYVLWNMEYGRDTGDRVTQPSKMTLNIDLDENAVVIGDQTFLPSLVGTLKTGDGVHGAMSYARGVFTYYSHKGAPTGIAGKLAGSGRLTGSSFNDQGYKWRTSGDTYFLSSTQYAILLRYPWDIFAAASEAGIDVANDGVPVKGRFHFLEQWDCGFERDKPAEDQTHVYLRDGKGGAIYRKQAGCYVYGGQTLISNGDYVNCGRTYTFSISYDGYSRRNGSELLGQHIDFTDDSMWAFSNKAKNTWTWNPSDKEDLLVGDYHYRAFWIGFTERSGQYVNGYWVEDDTNSKDYAQFSPLYIYIKTQSDTDYQPYCAVTYSDTGEKMVCRWNGTDILEQIPATEASNGYPLPAETVAIRLLHDSSYYRTTFSLQLGVRVNPTAHMKDIVARHMNNNALTYIRNNSTCEISTLDGTHIQTFTSENGGFDRNHNRIILSPLTATMSLSKTSLTPDDTDSRQKAAAAQDKEISHVMLTAQMLVNLNPEDALHTNAEDSYKMLEGTFYELLPKGTNIQEGSINGLYDRYREQYPYSLSDWVKNGGVFHNYNTYRYVIPADCVDYSTYVDDATGQTMLVIHYKIEDPECTQSDGRWFNRVHFAFTLENSFDNVQDRGTQTPNALAFSIPQKPTPLSISPANQFETVDMGARGAAFENIRNSGDYTAYTQVNINWNAVRVLEAGFKKSISNQETLNGLPADNAYTAETRVTVGNGYSYRLKFSNNPKTKADHIVFYDVLEQGTADRPESAWRGTFRGLDLSSIQETPTDGGTAVCAPVVYYSTRTDFALVAANNDFGSLDDRSVWTTEMPDDRSSITAVAIDCSLDSQGESFILGREKSLTAYLLMDAPTAYVEGRTVNGAVVRSRLFENEPPQTGSGGAGISSDAAGLLSPALVSIEKSSLPASGTAEEPCVVPGNGSGTINYTVTVGNDSAYDLRNVVVNDVIPAGLSITGIQVALNGAAAKPIGELAGVQMEREGNSLRFVIAQQHPGEDHHTSFLISTTVDALTEAGERRYENTARISSANGIEQDLSSETTYHIAAVRNVDVEKKWYGAAKESVTIALMEGDTPIDTVVLDASCQWKHRFPLLEKYDGDVNTLHVYEPSEVQIPHYVSEITGNMDEGYVISNRELLQLTISKQITGNMGDRSLRFVFHVQIDCMKNKSFTGPDGTALSFDDSGLASFLLGDGESVTIPDVPGGVQVTVWEDQNLPYRASWSLTGTGASTGTGESSSFAMPNVNGSLRFTNHLQTPVPSGVALGPGLALALLLTGICGLSALALRRRRRRGLPTED